MCVGEQRVNYGLQFFGVCFSWSVKILIQSISSVCFLITAHSTYATYINNALLQIEYSTGFDVKFRDILKSESVNTKDSGCCFARDLCIETVGKFCSKMSVATDSILSLVSINLVVMATQLFQWQRCSIFSAVRLFSLSIETGYF